MSKKLPPYARPLKDLQLQNTRPLGSVNVWIGKKAWQKGKSFSSMLPTRNIVIPPWISPNNYEFPVNQCDILIHDTGHAELEYVHELVVCLYEFGADIVRYVAPDFTLTIFHKD